jgi:hypothetical protein
VPIHGFIKGTGKFPIQKSPFSASSRKSINCAEAYSCTPHKQFRRLVRLGRDLSAFGAIDAEIAEKGHLWMETK